MSKRLYIGNLPYSATESTLRELFSPHGQVTSVSIITDRDSGQSKGFGFIEMADDAAALQAINQVNGKAIGDRTITVAEARPQRERFNSGGGDGFGSGRRGGSDGGRGGYGGGHSGGRTRGRSRR